MSDSESDSEDKIVSLKEVINNYQKLQDESASVLGAADDEHCSYQKGYMKRQPLYSCLTCQEKSGKIAGICLACSYHCHEDHKFIELYTKRNFRCDCGNDKFPEQTCTLQAEKESENILNKYDDNFKGVYCNCKKPYPDPEGTTLDDMLQCIVCEDWFHTSHIEGELPVKKEFDEMICGLCSKKLDFLKHYLQVSAIQEESGNDVEADNGNKTDETAVDIKSEMEGNSSMVKAPEVCALKNNRAKKPIDFATFWPNGWRDSLCVCSSCKEMYKTLDVEFLLDCNDSLSRYSQEGIQKYKQMMRDRASRGWSSFSRVRQIEFYRGINDLKEQFTNFLNRFGPDKVVGAEDVKQFFDDMNRRRREGASSSGIQHNCR